MAVYTWITGDYISYNPTYRSYNSIYNCFCCAHLAGNHLLPYPKSLRRWSLEVPQPKVKMSKLACSPKKQNEHIATRMSMEVTNQLVSWFITCLQDLQPTYKWVMIHFLSISRTSQQRAFHMFFMFVEMCFVFGLLPTGVDLHLVYTCRNSNEEMSQPVFLRNQLFMKTRWCHQHHNHKNRCYSSLVFYQKLMWEIKTICRNKDKMNSKKNH